MMDPQPNDGFRWTQAPWGGVLECAPLAAVASHLFTTANLRLSQDDEREWQAVAERMGVERRNLRLIRQVHGVAVVTAHRDEAPVRGEADIIVSGDEQVAIGVRVADCTPILIADRRRPAVGAAHAGWRGTVQRAAAVLVDAMRQTFGSQPADLVAAIGPCLGPCCGEVGPEVVEAFRDAGHRDADVARWFTTGATDRPYLNLWAANRDQLLAAGVPEAQIHLSGICTRSYPSVFHSYRAQGAIAGRMVAAIRTGRTGPS